MDAIAFGATEAVNHQVISSNTARGKSPISCMPKEWQIRPFLGSNRSAFDKLSGGEVQPAPNGMNHNPSVANPIERFSRGVIASSISNIELRRDNGFCLFGIHRAENPLRAGCHRAYA